MSSNLVLSNFKLKKPQLDDLDPNEEIAADKFNMKWLNGKYWTEWKDTYDNVQTGVTLTLAHKCNVCKGPLQKSCYDRFHHAFCPEWMTVERVVKNESEILKVVKFEEGERLVDTRLRDDSKLALVIRARHGQRYCVESGGCDIHPHIDCFNRGIKLLARGLPITPIMFEDAVLKEMTTVPEEIATTGTASITVHGGFEKTKKKESYVAKALRASNLVDEVG